MARAVPAVVVAAVAWAAASTWAWAQWAAWAPWVWVAWEAWAAWVATAWAVTAWVAMAWAVTAWAATAWGAPVTVTAWVQAASKPPLRVLLGALELRRRAPRARPSRAKPAPILEKAARPHRLTRKCQGWWLIPWIIRCSFRPHPPTTAPFSTWLS